MSTPVEFTKEYLAEHTLTGSASYSYYGTTIAGEPMASLKKNNPFLDSNYGMAIRENARDCRDSRASDLIANDEIPYWETTVARKHPYWKDKKLPVPTKNINQLRQDFSEWGYCLIEEGLSETQTAALLKRVSEQSAAEETAGTLDLAPEGYRLWGLVNKGQEFVGIVDLDPEYIQAGLLVEQLLEGFVGGGWIVNSFLGLCADPDRLCMPIHIDQSNLLPWVTETPALVNTMIMVDDVDEHNGGTLIVPGSHKIMLEEGGAGNISAHGDRLRPINMEAKAGTLLMWDGRLLHSNGINKTDKPRRVVVLSAAKPWIRSQENYALLVAPDVLEAGSPKLRYRLGLQATSAGGSVEGFGIGASGTPGDFKGDMSYFRRAIDNGTYTRVRALTPQSSEAEFNKPYTIKQAWEALDDASNKN